MSHDALFQLGMGPVQLDTTQTEEFIEARGVNRCVAIFRAACSRMRIRLAILTDAALLRVEAKDRGNSAKARMRLARGTTRAPSA